MSSDRKRQGKRRPAGQADRPDQAQGAAAGTGGTTGLSIDELAIALRVPAETIRRHIEQGAPIDDGQINPIFYAAWLLRQLTDGPEGAPTPG